MGVREGCKPRAEVLKGDLDDAIFAADFGDVVEGRAPAVYKDATTFFQNTHPAAQLKKVVEVVFHRLADNREGGATLRLSTGFGGGKTHTLIALWHLAQHITDAAMGTELLPAAGRPGTVKVAAVDAGKAGVPDFASHGAVKVHSLWGELFYRLGGEQAVKALGKADDPEASPNESQVLAAFPKGPLLILLDELVIYMAKLSDRGQGNLLGFLGTLASVVSKRPQTVLVVTDPADQRVYAKEAAQLGDRITAAAVKLDDIFGRKFSDFDPIGSESARVIVRRLFDRVDEAAAQKTSAAYHSLFSRLHQDSPGTIPPGAASPDYARRIVDSYPFHPRLLDTAQDRLAALQDFHKSRGVLRLFARILRDVWDSKLDVELISAGEVNWSSSRIQSDLLQRLNKDPFMAAVGADIEKHAKELDGGNDDGVHRRAASALLLESLPMQSSSGLDGPELTLAVLRPDEAGPEPGEALDRLVGLCWHTYPLAGGRGWQFRFEPNVNRQIEERMGKIPVEDARAKVLAEAQGYFGGPAFRLAAWPASPRQVPEVAELQLALCETEPLARAVVAYEDDSDPQAPIPRRFTNAIVAVTATPAALNAAIERAQRLLAAEAIEREARTGESNRLTREQVAKLKPELLKWFRIQTCRAFDRVVLHGRGGGPLDEKYQVPDDQVLQRPQGQVCLKKFLTEKKLVFDPEDALDVDRFLKEVLPGAVPAEGTTDTYTARAIHERFLATPGLRLLQDGAVVRTTIVKGVRDGRLVVKLANGNAYDKEGCVAGPPGQRRRSNDRLSTVSLDDAVLVALASAYGAAEWLRESAKAGDDSPPRPPVPVPKPGRITASSWAEIAELAAMRPLLELKLRAGTPAAAKTLAGLAQPLGASTITLSVMVGGDLKQGGSVNFAASGLGLNNPIKALEAASTLFNATVEGSSYEAELVLTFTPGRSDLEAQLGQLASKAGDAVTPEATFDKPKE